MTTTLPPVPITPRQLDDYRDIVGQETVDRARELARPLRGARVLHINATAFGGGVAELLYALIPLMRDVGLTADWCTIESADEFFTITKLMHNALQGMELPLTEQMKEIYLAQNEVNARLFDDSYDFVIVHDPQPAAMVSYVNPDKRAGKWIWRCHLDMTSADESAWQFLLPHVTRFDAAIFTMREYVPRGLEGLPTFILTPSIDPLSPKNAPLDDTVVQSVISKYNIDRRRPFMMQVSRFDPWKNPLGVIDVFRMTRDRVPELQLVMLSAMASDDPEGWHYYEKTTRHAGGDPDIHILTNTEGIGHIEVNAFQRAAGVVVQRSLREGFGLVVTEGLWKGKPVVASPVGGIVLQVMNGDTGYLVSTAEEAVERAAYLLENPDVSERMGKAAIEHVRRNFLSPRNLINYLQLLHDVS